MVARFPLVQLGLWQRLGSQPQVGRCPQRQSDRGAKENEERAICDDGYFVGVVVRCGSTSEDSALAAEGHMAVIGALRIVC